MSNNFKKNIVNEALLDFQKGNKKKAFNLLKSYLSKNKNDFTAKYNYAVMCEELGFIDLAIKNYNEIISLKNDNWKSKFNLYLIYIKQKKFYEAIKLIEEVLKINKDYQPALRDKALVKFYLKQPDEALPIILKSINLNPKDYIAGNTLGMILISLKQYEESIKVLKKILLLNNKYIHTYNNLGRAYTLLFNRKKADEYFEKALEINPNFFEALNNLANNLNETGDYSKAVEYYLKALKVSKNNSEIYGNIALAYTRLGHLDKAEEFYKKSFQEESGNDVLKKNYSLFLFYNQKYNKAWKYYDGRLSLDGFKNENSTIAIVKDFLWKDNSINTKDKILVLREQGVGDEILYSSMYSELLEKYPNTIIEADERLISVFERSFNKKNTFFPAGKFSKRKDYLKNFNKIIYAASLGKIFRTNKTDFPKTCFLKTEISKYKKIKSAVNKLSDKIKIGISWRSNVSSLGSDRSLELKQFLPLFMLEKFTFINLQYGDTEEEVKSLNKKNNYKLLSIDGVDLFNDFESQAALLKNLDLFINTGNSIAHLAAALGVESWVIKPKPHFSFHYWYQPNNSTPWYPSVKLFSIDKGADITLNNIKKELLKKFN